MNCTERREWLSFERHRHRMADFGTRVGVDLSATTAVAVADAADGYGNGTTVIDVTDSTWKETLEAGCLIDARDSNGVWYRVRFHCLRVSEDLIWGWR